MKFTPLTTRVTHSCRGFIQCRSSLRTDCRGVAAVEFALTVPVILMLLFAVIEFGRLVFTHGTITFAAEEATRFATVNYDATAEDLKNVATSRVPGVRKDRITSVDVQSVLDTDDKTKLVTVSISYNHQFLLPIFDIDGVTLKGASKGFLVEE